MKLVWVIKHLARVAQHKSFLYYTGRKFGVSYYRILIHDLSKLSWIEVKAYARQFYAPEEERDWDEFKRGWLHHVNKNPHHWQHWILSGREEKDAIEMPEKFAREMVADWMAASRSYTGSWDMQNWLCKNWGKMRLHPKTREFVLELLKKEGYKWWLFPKVKE